MGRKASRAVSASIKRYYDSLTDEEVAKDHAWGMFVLSQFSHVERVKGKSRAESKIHQQAGKQRLKR